ncbi:SRPBCC domain-containing protein [Micromonospora sp. NPDC049366]|uniref:SRPBCC domain-containing protein n=1 Tax=Micromonospora sp. NPDC049366 TaxID=3364271 RepID=UPI0037B53FBA
MSDPGTVEVDQFLPHPPVKVWRALTDFDLLGRWLMPNDFAPVVGHRFTFRTDPRPGQDFDGTVHCEVLDLDPPRLLRWAWRGGRLDTVVTWTLVPEGRGTRLFLEHTGFDPDDPLQARTRDLLGGGWRSHVLSRLHALLTETP